MRPSCAAAAAKRLYSSTITYFGVATRGRIRVERPATLSVAQRSRKRKEPRSRNTPCHTVTSCLCYYIYFPVRTWHDPRSDFFSKTAIKRKAPMIHVSHRPMRASRCATPSAALAHASEIHRPEKSRPNSTAPLIRKPAMFYDTCRGESRRPT